MFFNKILERAEKAGINLDDEVVKKLVMHAESNAIYVIQNIAAKYGGNAEIYMAKHQIFLHGSPRNESALIEELKQELSKIYLQLERELKLLAARTITVN